MPLVQHVSDRYPWLTEAWQAWLLAKKRLGHAYLFTGQTGMAIGSLTQQIAESLLCQASSTSSGPCGQCNGCHSVNLSQHPDYIELAPLEGKKEVTVDQVRGLQQMINQTSHQAGLKVILIHRLEYLNLAAFNALLKSLEEPPEQTIFIMTSYQLGRLPATIRSRCQLFKVASPRPEQACFWLREQLDSQVNIERALAFNWDAPVAALNWIEQGLAKIDNQWLSDIAALEKRQKTVTQVIQGWLKWDEKFNILQAFQVQVQTQLWRCLDESGPQQAWLDLTQQLLRAEKEFRGHVNKALFYENITMGYLIACQSPNQKIQGLDFSPMSTQGFGL